MANVLTQDYDDSCQDFDKDGEEQISMDEVGASLESMEQKSQAELEDVFSEVDNDGNGFIYFEEFLERLPAHSITLTAKIASEVFRVLDKDGNGFITASYLRQVMTNIGDKLTVEEAKYIVRDIDIDGDCQVNYEEFLKMMSTH